MRTSLASLSLLLLAAGLAFGLAACGKDAPKDSGPGATAPAPASKWSLASDPGGGISVAEGVKAAPKDDALVVGRVKDVTKGFAAFTLADVSLAYCGQGGGNMPECEEPWDYCCVTDELPGKVLTVEVRGADGQPVATPRLGELRNLDLVVVRGRLVKDPAGNVTLVATGWFRRERPTLPDTVKFP